MLLSVCAINDESTQVFNLNDLKTTLIRKLIQRGKKVQENENDTVTERRNRGSHGNFTCEGPGARNNVLSSVMQLLLFL